MKHDVVAQIELEDGLVVARSQACLCASDGPTFAVEIDLQQVLEHRVADRHRVVIGDLDRIERRGIVRQRDRQRLVGAEDDVGIEQRDAGDGAAAKE